MRQLWRDIVSHRRTVWFGAFWFSLLTVTALTWDRGIPPWLFFIHLLALPFLAGVTTRDFRLNSGIAGFLVSLVNLFIVTTVPMSRLSLVASPPPPPVEPVFAGWAGVLEVFEFVVLMGVPGYLLGLLGAWLPGRLAKKPTGQ